MVESEFPMVAAIGVGLLTVLFLLFLRAVYRKRMPRTGMLCFALQWLFTLAAFGLFSGALSVRQEDAMFTRTVSWLFGLAGSFWAVSILCMLLGVWKLLHVGASKQT